MTIEEEIAGLNASELDRQALRASALAIIPWLPKNCLRTREGELRASDSPCAPDTMLAFYLGRWVIWKYTPADDSVRSRGVKAWMDYLEHRFDDDPIGKVVCTR